MVRETKLGASEKSATTSTRWGSIHRRELLAAIGMGAIAGCSGDDGSGGSGNPTNATFNGYISPDTNIERIGFNLWNPTSEVPSVLENLMYQSGTRFNLNEHSWEPTMFEDWEYDQSNETLTFTIEDGYNWDNGDPVVAEDFWVDKQVELGMYDGATDFYEGISIDDEKTFTLELTGAINLDVLMPNLRLEHRYREGPYREYADRFAEASSQSEYDEIKNEVEEFTISDDDVHASGPFKVSEVTESYYTLVPNEGHKYSDDINFEKIELVQAGEWSTVQGLLMSEQLDTGGEGARFTKSFVENVPDRYDVYHMQRFGGPSIDFQLTHDIYGIREVRQAFNHIVDKEQIVDSVDFDLNPDQHSTGMPDSVATNWLDEETLNSFTDYTGQNFDEARALLQDAGFEEGSDTWLTPNGEEWSVSLSAPAGDTDRIQYLDLAKDHLEDFGINAELETIETSTYWSQYREQDWDVATYAFGDRFSAHPYEDFSFQYIGINPGQPGAQEAWAGTPLEVEVPMPVGDPDGSLETVNYYDKINEIRTAHDEDRVQELITECAWIYNQQSFKVPIAVERLPNFVNTEDWEMPDNHIETFESYNAAWWQLLAEEGELQAQ